MANPLPYNLSQEVGVASDQTAQKKFILSVVTIGLIGCCVFNYYISPFDDLQRIYFMGWMGWGAFIWSLWSWWYLFKELLCPNVIFLSVAYLFTFSQCLLLIFNLVPEEMNLLLSTDRQLYFKAQVFTLVCLLCYHFGSILGGKKRQQNNEIEQSEALFQAVKKVGITLFAVSAIPYFFTMMWEMITVRHYGYGGLYDHSIVVGGLGNSLLNKIFGFVGSYCLPSLLCLLVAYTKNTVRKMWVYGALIAIILSVFFMGGRSNAAILIGLITLYRHYYVKPVRGVVKIVALVAAAFLLLSFMTVIGQIRSEKNRSIMDYGNVFLTSITTENLVVKAVSEMGGSMFPLLATIDLVPEQYQFRKGKTYFYDFLSLVPNLGVWDVHPAMKNANLGDWLQKALKLSYGPGYSLVAEAYINWGLCGFVFFIIQGFVFGRIFTAINMKNAFSRPDIFCFILILLLFTIKTNRNSFLATVRAFGYAAVPIFIMFRVVYANSVGRLEMIQDEQKAPETGEVGNENKQN